MASNDRAIDDLESIACLPGRFRNGGDLPKRIIGARIVTFGAAPRSADFEGGSLVIDYVPKGKENPVRVVLSFTELGMWIAAEGLLKREGG